MRRIRQKLLECGRSLLDGAHHDQQETDAYGDIEVESIELLPILERRQSLLDIDELVTTLREGPTDRAIARREAYGVPQRQVGRAGDPQRRLAAL